MFLSCKWVVLVVLACFMVKDTVSGRCDIRRWTGCHKVKTNKIDSAETAEALKKLLTKSVFEKILVQLEDKEKRDGIVEERETNLNLQLQQRQQLEKQLKAAARQAQQQQQQQQGQQVTEQLQAAAAATAQQTEKATTTDSELAVDPYLKIKDQIYNLFETPMWKLQRLRDDLKELNEISKLRNYK